MDKTLLDWAAPRSRNLLTIIYGDCKVLILRKSCKFTKFTPLVDLRFYSYRPKKESECPKLIQISPVIDASGRIPSRLGAPVLLLFKEL